MGVNFVLTYKAINKITVNFSRGKMYLTKRNLIHNFKEENNVS